MKRKGVMAGDVSPVAMFFVGGSKNKPLANFVLKDLEAWQTPVAY